MSASIGISLIDLKANEAILTNISLSNIDASSSGNFSLIAIDTDNLTFDTRLWNGESVGETMFNDVKLGSKWFKLNKGGKLPPSAPHGARHWTKLPDKTIMGMKGGAILWKNLKKLPKIYQEKST